MAGGLNLYGYAGSDPVNLADPIGLCPWCKGEAFPEIGRRLAPAQGPMEIAGTIVTAPLAGGMGMVGRFGMMLGLGRATAPAAASVPAVRVLGHYPAYLQVGEAIGGKVFEIPTNVWNSMSEAAQWAANQKFLDRGIAQGAEFVMATLRTEVRSGSALAKEIGYLRQNGYQWSKNGQSLIPK